MSEFEHTIKLPGSNYGEVLIVNKRGDNYQIILGREPKKTEGTIMWQMCYPQFDKKPRDKAVPWCFTLGNYTQAREVLTALLAVFTKPAQAKNEPDDSQIPF